MITQGNVDTELGTGGQSFEMGVGNFNSEGLPFVPGNIANPLAGGDMFTRYFEDVMARLSERRQGNPTIDRYAQLGQQLMGAFMQGPQEAAPMQASNLTAGFQGDWLNQRLAAGSADGAKIGGMSMGKGGGKKRELEGEKGGWEDTNGASGGEGSTGWA